MNRFGRYASDAWQTLAPTAYAQIEDPDRHFSTLGEQAEDAWVQLTLQMQGPDQPEEDFWGKMGRITNAQLRAEEIVRADWLTPPSEVIEPDPDEDEPDPWQQIWREIEAEGEKEFPST